MTALNADAELLDASERGDIDAALTTLRTVLRGDDADAIEDATKAVSAATDEFAARRMDKSIRVALSGRRLDEI